MFPLANCVQGCLVGLDAFTAVAFCPTNRTCFLSCDASAVCLWDLRRSFGPDALPSLENARRCKQRVQRQYGAVCRHRSGVMFLPEIHSVTFNQRGTHFVCSVSKAVPLLYRVQSETPLMAFHAAGYSNKVPATCSLAQPLSYLCPHRCGTPSICLCRCPCRPLPVLPMAQHV